MGSHSRTLDSIDETQVEPPRGESPETENPETEVPRRVGTYRITGVLGRGGMGQVYRGYHVALDRQVAIKAVRRGVAADRAVRLRFRREAQLMAKINHPAVVQVYDLLDLPEGDFIVMELVEGRQLRDDFLEDRFFDVAALVDIGIQIAEGLGAAHRLGIIHRDLKSENIMLTPDGRVKLLDFGLARSLLFADHRGDADQPVMGTLRALSPEQAKGLEVDSRCDLFSLGVLLYELATGRSPFVCGDIAETLVRLCTHHQEPAKRLRGDLPDELSHLLDHLLEKDPALRPESAAHVLEGLRAIEPSKKSPPRRRGARGERRPDSRTHEEHTLPAIPGHYRREASC